MWLVARGWRAACSVPRKPEITVWPFHSSMRCQRLRPLPAPPRPLLHLPCSELVLTEAGGTGEGIIPACRRWGFLSSSPREVRSDCSP